MRSFSHLLCAFALSEMRGKSKRKSGKEPMNFVELIENCATEKQ